MTALEKYRQQVRIARDGNSYVVQTADEAQALLDEIDPPRGTLYLSDETCRRFKAAGILPEGAYNVRVLDPPWDDEVV